MTFVQVTEAAEAIKSDSGGEATRDGVDNGTPTNEPLSLACHYSLDNNVVKSKCKSISDISISCVHKVTDDSVSDSGPKDNVASINEVSLCLPSRNIAAALAQTSEDIDKSSKSSQIMVESLSLSRDGCLFKTNPAGYDRSISYVEDTMLSNTSCKRAITTGVGTELIDERVVVGNEDGCVAAAAISVDGVSIDVKDLTLDRINGNADGCESIN